MSDTIQMLGYQEGKSFIYKLNTCAKLWFFVCTSVACMTTYDTRFLLFIGVFSLLLFKISAIKWCQVSFVVKFIVFFSLLNLIAVYLFDPLYATRVYGSNSLLFGSGHFQVTREELFYLFNLLLKYCCTTPLAILFLLTTNPSQFASTLNRMGISYKVAYAVSLALRYIPDVQTDFFAIIQAQQARGFELSKKAHFFARLKGYAQVLLPLVFSSLDRIDTISTAMELRRFGKGKRRTWYSETAFTTRDVLVTVLSMLFLGGSIVLFFLNKGRFYNPFS